MSGDTSEAAVCAVCGKPLVFGWLHMHGKYFCSDCFKAQGKDYERLLDMASNAIDFDKVKKEMVDDLLCQL